MRLGQLARKLNVRPSEIASFLAQNGIHVEEGSNVRLEENQVVLIVNHFDAANAAFFLTEKPQVGEILKSAAEETPEAENEPEAPQRTLEEPSTNEESQATEKPEVIRAPKVELSGLKVLGKIELPEKKKKEEKTDLPQDEVPAEDREVKHESRPSAKKTYPQKDRNKKPVVNPVALQREREAREVERKKREELKREKEKRAQHYQNRVKSAPTKPAKKLEEPVQEIRETDDEIPVSRWKRFLRWWNT